MKKSVYTFLILMLICIGCQRNTNTIIGTWKAEKVEVDFDEHHSTPEIVKQTGNIEKRNALVFTEDSTLTFIGHGDTIKGNFSVKNAQISFSGKPFGTITENEIITNEETPFGNISVTYRKVQ